MEQIAKTKFSALSSAELAVIGRILEIRSVKTVLGYFVPVERMRLVEFASNQAQQDECWGVTDLLDKALAEMAGEG